MSTFIDYARGTLANPAIKEFEQFVARCALASMQGMIECAAQKGPAFDIGVTPQYCLDVEPLREAVPAGVVDANNYWKRGDLASARRALNKAADEIAQLPDHRNLRLALAQMAALQVIVGDEPAARATWGKALPHFERAYAPPF